MHLPEEKMQATHTEQLLEQKPSYWNLHIRLAFALEEVCCGWCGLSLRRATKCFTFPFFSDTKGPFTGQSHQAECVFSRICPTF